MTREELAERVCAGWFLVAGQVLAASVDRAGYVDRRTGLAAQSIVITYFVESRVGRGADLLKITKRAPADASEPTSVSPGVEKGRVYAFPIEALERKPGFVLARMGCAMMPEPVEVGESPLGAPQGAPAAAPNLVHSQTTPQHP